NIINHFLDNGEVKGRALNFTVYGGAKGSDIF
ncbi:hypothetical protein AAUPMC_00485, partial [Pasteurella multocida subsp. multocida str. Anand1_cattle]